MYRITKDFAFSASHVLTGLSPGHQCARLHGHNYVVRLMLTSDFLDATGFVWDYGRLDPFKRIVDELDHRHLNDLFPNFNPTAENLASWLLAEARRYMPDAPVVAVGVSETPKTWAWIE